MDKETAQALYDLQQTGRLSPDVNYEVRDTLDLVSDEEREEHDQQVKREKADVDAATKTAKATDATKKAS